MKCLFLWQYKHLKQNISSIMQCITGNLAVCGCDSFFFISYQIMQMYCLNRRLQKTNVTVNSIHPGIVDTEINRSFSDLGMWKMFFQLSKIIGKCLDIFYETRRIQSWCQGFKHCWIIEIYRIHTRTNTHKCAQERCF